MKIGFYQILPLLMPILTQEHIDFIEHIEHIVKHMIIINHYILPNNFINYII